MLALFLMTLLAADKQVPDGVITDQVRVKLANDRDVGGMAINVEVQQGAVTLTGKVRTEKQRSQAEKLAKKVKGVTSVTNKLIISPDQ